MELRKVLAATRRGLAINPLGRARDWLLVRKPLALVGGLFPRLSRAAVVTILLLCAQVVSIPIAQATKNKQVSSCSLVPGSSATETATNTALQNTSVGGDLDQESLYPVISQSGRYIAFQSAATNANPADPTFDIDALPDTNNAYDVYVYDSVEDSLTRASYNYAAAQEPNGSSQMPGDISDNGRYVVFLSDASNLVSGDTNGTWDVFRFDQFTGQTQRVSVGSGGTQANGGSDSPRISGDGHLVVFKSDATNLVAGDTNGRPDIFLRDMNANTTTRISVTSTGGQSSYGGDHPVMSADGRFVGFSSLSQLVPSDTNQFGDAYRRDLSTGALQRVSVSLLGGDPNAYSYPSDLSADGRYVAFASYASNLVSGDTNSTTDSFVRDTATNVTLRASVGPNGQANDWSEPGTLSDDGHYLVFSSGATNLWPTSDGNGAYADIFEFDVWSNQLAGHLSVDPNDVWANRGSFFPAISGNSVHVAYHSDATNLVALDGNSAPDIFTHTWADPQRTDCDTRRRSKPIPLPLPLAPISPGGGTKPDYDRRCQSSTPSGSDPLPNLTEAQRYEVFDSFPVSVSYQNVGTANLRKGTTNFVAGARSGRGDWLGWGYRKIKAKHGWGTDVRARVALALSQDTSPVITGGRYRYTYGYRIKGVNCTMRVIVDYIANEWEVQKGYPAAHIITAYAFVT